MADNNKKNYLRTISEAIAAVSLSSIVFYLVDADSGNSASQSDKHILEDILVAMRETTYFLIEALPLMFKILGLLLLSVMFCFVMFYLTKSIYSGSFVIPQLLSSLDRKKKRYSNVNHDNSTTLYPGVEMLNQLIEYSHKRRDLEAEIARLTAQLTKTEIADYYDINRLVISGQGEYIGNGAIDYKHFLEQFGINPETVTIRKNYAVFLTPFTNNGKAVFDVCQGVLNKLGILLQMTDNSVKKSDIMMNIVSKIVEAHFLIVNIDGRNPNVYYELGIAHALGKPTILISNSDYPEDELSFDIRQKNVILFKNYDMLERELLYVINQLQLGN